MKSRFILAIILTAPLVVLNGCSMSLPNFPYRVDWKCQQFNKGSVKMPLKKARLICAGQSAKHQKVDKPKTCTTNIYSGALGVSGTQNCYDDAASTLQELGEKDNVFLACMAEQDWECEPIYGVLDEASGKHVYQIFDKASGDFVDYDPEQQ